MPCKLPPKPAPTDLKLRKRLSAPGLLALVRKEFETIVDHRRGHLVYSLAEVLMSALAMFGLKYPSLLQFDQTCQEITIRTNLRNCYGVTQVPSDTQMRSILDPVNPEALKSSFIVIHKELQRQRVLESYRYLGGFLLSIDGTGQFASNHLSCPQCCTRRLKNGAVQNYHQLLGAAVVNPTKHLVLPLFPEAIIHQDGETKNDCELQAGKRLLPAIRTAFPKLPFIVLEDSLAANGPHLRLLQELQLNYIIVAKPSQLASLFHTVTERVAAGEGEQLETMTTEGIWRRYRFLLQIPLNQTHPDLLTNFLEYWEYQNEVLIYHGSWITGLLLQGDNVYQVMIGGRARWKVENETFNTLKHQGYNLEHNYGHGHQYLATILAMLMMLHFLIDQVQELCCSYFQAARHRFYSRAALWERMRSLFLSHELRSWETLWKLIIYGFKPQVFHLDTS